MNHPMGKYDEAAIAKARAKRKAPAEPTLRPSMRQASIYAAEVACDLDTMGIAIDVVLPRRALCAVDILVVGERLPIRVCGFSDEEGA